MTKIETGNKFKKATTANFEFRSLLHIYAYIFIRTENGVSKPVIPSYFSFNKIQNGGENKVLPIEKVLQKRSKTFARRRYHLIYFGPLTKSY